MFPLALHNYFELLAALCGIVFWKNIRGSILARFVPYLIFIVTIELIGRYIRVELKTTNAWLYNISVPIEYLFFAFIFFLHFKNQTNRKLALGFLVFFTAYVVISLCVNGFIIFNKNVLIIGSFSMIVFAILSLIELYNQPGIISLVKEPIFWIATGVLLFNTGEFSYDLLSKFFFGNLMDKNAVIFRSINTYLNLFLYLCISISFLWKKDSAT